MNLSTTDVPGSKPAHRRHDIDDHTWELIEQMREQVQNLE
jgi:uncharacterized protein YicC (UPF0701 family)